MKDHRALVYLYHMRNFDLTVKHIPGKLNIVPDTLSRLSGESNEKPLSLEPALASICRNVPANQPYKAATPREFELAASRLESVERIQDDRELLSNAEEGI